MKLVSWNVNGIRASVKKGFVDVVRDFDADIFCVQETKAQDDQVQEALKELSEEYHIYSNSAERKGYSGTCILSKKEPIAVMPDIGVAEHDTEGRVLKAEYDAFNFVDVYVPNSGSGLKRLDYRATFDEAFCEYLYELTEEKPLIVTGDFNVAPAAIDLARPKENYNKTSGFTQVEIDGVEAMYRIGLFDTFRHFHPEKVQYTFWNQRLRARDRNVGWRIDYFLITRDLEDNLVSSTIHDRVLGSDHCPISIELAF